MIRPADRINDVNEYYFSAKLKELAVLQSKGAEIINLGIGSPDLPPPAEVRNTLAKLCLEPGNHGYQPGRGIKELRYAFSRWYQKYFGVTPGVENEILPLMGSKEGIMFISLAFINPGDEVLIPDPGYPAYEATCKIAEGKAVRYQLKENLNWLPDLTELRKLDLTRVRLMWVNYPNMPTGASASREFFEQLVAFGIEHDMLICNDNPYSFILNDHPLSILSVDGAFRVAMELNSLSKSHNMAGLRVGMLAGSKPYIDAVYKVKSNMDSGMFLPIQAAAVQALDIPDAWYHEINETYKQRSRLAEQLLESMGADYKKDQAGMFKWARIPDGFKHSEAFSDHLLQSTGIFVTPGFIFGEQGTMFFRISLCSDLKTFEKAIHRIEKDKKL